MQRPGPLLQMRLWNVWAGRLVACVLLLFTSGVFPEPSASEPWDEGHEYNAFLLRRLSYVLDGLKYTARSEAALKDLLDRIHLRTPTESLVERNPNSYAKPDIDNRLIVIEQDFVAQIGALSAAGAYLAAAEMNGVDENARAQICAQLARIDHEATNKSVAPVFTINLDAFPDSANPPTRRLLHKLMGLIADEASVWFLLHEAGHHALGHHPLPEGTKADSRKQEAKADRWASQTMTRLGFGLFGPEQYLLGRAVMDQCLIGLGYVDDEAESTHPTWRAREANMRKEFDVHSTGRASGSGDLSRTFYLPLENKQGPTTVPVDIFVYPGQPRLYEGTYISRGSIMQHYRHIPAASEWQGKSVTVYVQGQSGGRLELQIPNVNEAISVATRFEFDAMNRQTRVPLSGLAIQLNPTTFDWLEIAPGIRVGDLRLQRYDLFRRSLEAVGTQAEAIPSILIALEEDEPAMAAVQLAYMKGTITFGEMVVRAKALDTNHELKLKKLLGADRYARFVEVAKSDPVISKWLPSGSLPSEDPDYHRKLEEEMLKRNFDIKD